MDKANKASRQNSLKNSPSANNSQENNHEDSEKTAFSEFDNTQSSPNVHNDSNDYDIFTQQYIDVIPIVKNYYKSLKCRERLDCQIFDIEMECYFNQINDNSDATLIDLILLYGNLRDILKKNHEIARQMDEQTVQNLLKNPRNSKEKVQLDLLIDLIDSLQEQLKATETKRKNLHAKLSEIKKISSELANGRETGTQEDPGTSNESSSIGRKRNADTIPVIVPAKKINIYQQRNTDRAKPNFNRLSKSQESRSTDSGTATLRSNDSPISVMSTSQANLSQASTSQGNLSQFSTSQANLSQPSTSQANLSQPSTSQANFSQLSTSQANLSQPSTSQANLSQPSTSQADLSEPSTYQGNMSQILMPQRNLPQVSTSQTNKQTFETNLLRSSIPQIKVVNLPMIQEGQLRVRRIVSENDWHTPTEFTPRVKNTIEDSQTNNSSRQFMATPSGNVLDIRGMSRNLRSQTVPPTNAGRPANVQPKHIRGLTGLSNPGDHSHINSVIQCVNNTPLFPKDFLTTARLNLTRDNPIVKEFSRVFLGLWNYEHKTVTANALKIAFEKSVCEGDGTRRTDPINFLKYLLQSLHLGLKVSSEKRKLRSTSNSAVAAREMLKSIGGYTSIISDFFYGQKRLTITCEICKNSTVVYESFSSLTIPVPRSGLGALLTKRPRYDLPTMLADYFEEDRIAGFECPRCGVSCNATTKIDLTSLPPILILHLERCKDDGPMNCSLLKYPLDNLNLTPFFHVRPDRNSNDQKTHHYNYKLYAVCARNNVVGNDCFFAECQSSTQLTWHTFVDELVTETTTKQVTKHMSTCCLLFYSSFPYDPDLSSKIGK